MPTTNITTTIPLSDPPTPPKKREYVGYFRYGSQAPMSLVFDFSGDLKGAKDRWYLHCERMGYKHICCRVHKVDLDEREKRRADLNNDDWADT